MAKIKDVADAAGVSTATVSRVLAGKPHVSAKVKERVLSVVKELDYHPNRVAQSLRCNTSVLIALIIADIENPFFQRLSRAVDDVAQEFGYNVMVCNTDEDPVKEKRCFNLLPTGNVAGIILAPTAEGINNFADTYPTDVPMVMVDRSVRNFDVDNVLINNVSSACKMVSHLLASGHRRVAGVFGSSSTGQKRREGYLKAHRDVGVEPIDVLQKYTSPREEDGFSAAMELLELADRPDAIFASNSLLASGVIRAIRTCNLTIPSDIAVGCFDDTTWAQLLQPALTVIEQPTYELGKTAAEMLIKRIKDPKRPHREVVLKTRLIVRYSCGGKAISG